MNKENREEFERLTPEDVKVSLINRLIDTYMAAIGVLDLETENTKDEVCDGGSNKDEP